MWRGFQNRALAPVVFLGKASHPLRSDALRRFKPFRRPRRRVYHPGAEAVRVDPRDGVAGSIFVLRVWRNGRLALWSDTG
jgi:hypothetical protein